MKQTKNRAVLSAMFVALSVAMGYFFLAVPNVEMISATVFIAGAVVGPLYGALIGGSAELLFSLFNPMGSAAPPLLVAQVLAFALIGALGGCVGSPGGMPLWRKMIVYGLCGFWLTLFYDALTTLSFTIYMAGFDLQKLAAIFTAGALFTLTHVLVNTAIFTTIVPFILLGIQRYLHEQHA
ncbi:ECF transporter S component [candidate division KSB1 bacterium]|nr:ECF transporter S component [candidate division KSB1 bacterium]